MCLTPEYHATSTRTDGLEIVALHKVPAIGLQVVDEVRIVAPEQASLDGGTGSVNTYYKGKYLSISR
jgi:hypothetical protein